MPSQHEPDPEEFIRIGDYAELNHIHKSTVHRWINKGILPPPERRSEKVVGWTRRRLAAHWTAKHEGEEV